MQKLEQDFFEEYKRLDALCRDLLSAERGVSAYLEEMEAAPNALWPQLPGWEDDYYTLKHLRWVRNQIAHEPGFAGCTPEDLQALAAFTRRVLGRQDPLALLYRAGQAQAAVAAPRAGRKSPQAGGQHTRAAGGARHAQAAKGGRQGRPQPHPWRTLICAGVLLALFAFLLLYLLFLPPQ